MPNPVRSECLGSLSTSSQLFLCVTQGMRWECKTCLECEGLLEAMYQQIPETCFDTTTWWGKGKVLNVTWSWKAESLNSRSLAENMTTYQTTPANHEYVCFLLHGKIAGRWRQNENSPHIKPLFARPVDHLGHDFWKAALLLSFSKVLFWLFLHVKANATQFYSGRYISTDNVYKSLQNDSDW